jgi:hypothetical protein
MGTSVFANFLLDSEERLLRMKDSFDCIVGCNFEHWYVNARGRFSAEARDFLAKQLNGKLTFFYLDTSEGWLADSLTMIENADSDYFLMWFEDILCVGGVDYLNEVLVEMHTLSADFLMHSFFHSGMELSSFDSVLSGTGVAVAYSDYGHEEHKRRLAEIRERGLICSTFVVSLPSILRRDLLREILQTRPTSPKWPKRTPFDFEREPHEIGLLPMRRAIPLRELFAAIDDDHGEPGYSLIARGQYAERVPRENLTQNRGYSRTARLEAGIRRLGGRFKRRLRLSR